MYTIHTHVCQHNENDCVRESTHIWWIECWMSTKIQLIVKGKPISLLIWVLIFWRIFKHQFNEMFCMLFCLSKMQSLFCVCKQKRKVMNWLNMTHSVAQFHSTTFWGAFSPMYNLLFFFFANHLIDQNFDAVINYIVINWVSCITQQINFLCSDGVQNCNIWWDRNDRKMCYRVCIGKR